MKIFKLWSLVIVLATFASVGLFTPAKAQSSKYAVLCLSNNTDAEITYSYRWGNGQWQSSYLVAGETDIHSWRYTGRATSPNFQVEFDVDTSDYIVNQLYNLDRYSAIAKNCVEGKNYAFEYADWEVIDLYEVD